MKRITISFLFVCTALLFGQQLSPDTYFMNENGQWAGGIRCGTVDTAPADMLRSPADLLRWARQHPRQENMTIIIPVAFHIITSTSGAGLVPMSQLQAQIDTLNSGYASASIGFQLAYVDTTVNNAWYTVGYGSPEETAMKQALAIDPTHTLNFYTANLGGGLLGWAVFPWTYPESHFMHGVVILYSSLPGGTAFPYNEGDTGTHEIGHCLGLYHTFQNGCIPPGDYVDDTPYESSSAFGCPFGRDTCPADSGEDPIHNYMDYTDDACMFEFTPLQGVRIDWAINTYKPGFLVGAIATPSAPTNLSSYSDYNTPTSMLLNWDDPLTLTNGDTLDSGYFHIYIERNGVFVDSVAGAVEQFVDTGLVDGQEYLHTIYARLDSTNTFSDAITSTWIAGGSPIPDRPSEVSISSHQNEITLRWRNPNTNVDGTPIDDFAGVYVYQGNDSTIYNRSSADTAKMDSVTFTPPSGSTPGWYLRAFDNESPSHKSPATLTLIIPLNVPVLDNFAVQGLPNPGYWQNWNADVNDRALNMPSEPYSLNFNGMPAGGDTVESYPIDLHDAQGSGVVFSYFYQPQGTGNAPEAGDSLQVYFRNDLGDWVLVRGYPGMPVQDFQHEVINIETAPNGGGTFLHSQFKINIRSKGSAHPTIPQDDWFIDNIYLGLPAPAIAASQDSVLFDTTLVGDTSTVEIGIDNVGVQPLVVSQVLGSGGIFNVDITSFTVDVGSSQAVNISFSPQAQGNFAGWIQFVSNDPGNDTLNVYVEGNGEQVTGIAEGGELPKTFGVSPNYPNPFNPSTTIKYQLPRTSDVKLAIYNVLGQRVRTLVDARIEAGYHSVEWDGRNDAGAQVGSGVYIYRFSADNYLKVQKMVLMK
jgi:hypothetical protein